MYEVYLDGKSLFYPGDHVCALTFALLDRKLNESGTLNITVPPNNPLFDCFKRRISEVAVCRNGKEIWCGEVRNTGLNFKKEKTVYVVGELAYLNASSQPQKVYKNTTPLEFLTLLLNEHNSRVEKRKQFAVGMVTVGSEQYTWTTNYEKTLDYIRTEMCEKLGGYLRIRKENGIRYLDLVRLQDYGKTCSQPIKFGRNLLDYTSNMDADSIVTVIRPLGAKLETSRIEGVDEYLTIESVNDGKDFIENTDAINAGIGAVWETVHFNVLTDPAAVKTAGENWLQSKQFENMVLSVTAVDLSDINVNIQEFELGDCVRTIAKPFGMDKQSYITEQKLDLLNPVRKHNISIGEHVRKTYTQQVIAAQDEIKKQMPQNTVILELAKENASQIIKNATEGNIFFVNDDNGAPKELLIMDTADINTATKVWRWNLNGLGYSSTGYKGTYGLAFTMDGAIVADFITVGTLNSVKINNGGGRFIVDEDGNAVANSLTSSNATITGGSFKIKKSSFDSDVLVLDSDNYVINFSSNGVEFFNKTNNQFSTVDNYGLHLGTFSGGTVPHASGFSMFYGRSYYTDSARIVGDLTVTGTKSRVTETENYNERLLYCYETPSPMFGDLGEGQLDETGKCCIFLDDVFAETIDKDCSYQVLLQPYGNGQCYITERNAAYFVVEGTANMSFGWEIKATQKNFDTIRLEQYEEPETEESNVLEETYSYLETYLYDVESEVA